MSEQQANQLTLWAVSVMLPMVGIGKWWFAWVMKRNTHIRTDIGSWLIRMFVSIGFMFTGLGLVYSLSLVESYEWITLAIWVRWTIRIFVVVIGFVSLLSTGMLVRCVVPMLRDVEEMEKV